MTLSDEQLCELERLEREATAGPWHREYLELQRGGMMTLGIGAKDRPVCIVNGIVESPPGLRDVAFIVTLRNALPDLLREVRELRKRIAVTELELEFGCVMQCQIVREGADECPERCVLRPEHDGEHLFQLAVIPKVRESAAGGEGGK